MARSRRSLRLAALLAAAAALSLALAVQASAVPPHPCSGKVSVKRKSYKVMAHLVRCSFAKGWTVKFLRSHRAPSGFMCTAFNASNIALQCNGPRFRYFFALT